MRIIPVIVFALLSVPCYAQEAGTAYASPPDEPGIRTIEPGETPTAADLERQEARYDSMSNYTREQTAKRLGVTVQEMERRDNKRGDAQYLKELMGLELPGIFAGMRVKASPDSYRVVFFFTEDADQHLLHYTQDPDFIAQEVPYTYQELTEGMEFATGELSRNGIDFMAGCDVEKAECVIEVLDPEKAITHIELLINKYPFLRLEKTTGFIELTEIGGGTSLKGTRQRCTSGFNVVHAASAQVGLTTAGHCDNSVTDEWTGRRLAFETEQNGGSVDLQWHTQTGSRTPHSQINSILVKGRWQTITGWLSRSRMAIGDPVCKYGRTTGLTCGAIEKVDRKIKYKGVEGYMVHVIPDLDRKMTDKGDSGGPVFYGQTAYGMVHGRGDDGTPYEQHMFFMPLDRLLELGLKLIDEPFRVLQIPSHTLYAGTFSPVTYAFRGYPLFPMTIRVEYSSCPSGWTCTDASWVKERPTHSPQVYNEHCYPGGSAKVPVTFNKTLTLIDAAGYPTSTSNYKVHCKPRP